ncbi:MAG: hypothetical protein HYX63_02540 [Gammaproteobacteria bacterium]|nr:hypothetical protein [Gammaproteobacteria bacterium]
MKTSRFVPALSLLMLAACATTRVESYRDPAFVGRSFHCPLVVAQIDGPAHKRAIEDAFANKISSKGVRVFKGLDVFPPTRILSNEEKALAFIQSDADCMIFVSLKEGTVHEEKYEIRVTGK